MTFENGEQRYRFKVLDSTLEMTLFDETYPSGQKPEWFGKVEVKMVWEKE